MTTTPISQENLDIVMKDIIGIRSEPLTMIDRFNVVLYSLKGFKKNEETVIFIERFIEELGIMEPLPKMEIDPYLSTIADKIFKASEKMKVNPDRLSDHDLNDIIKPWIKNYQNLNIIYDTHSNPNKFLTKIVLKEDKEKSGFESPNVINLFDLSTTKIGAAGKQVGRTGQYLVVTVDQYDKVEKRDDITEEEYNEFKRLFNLFDTDHDGIITIKEFNEIINSTGVKFSWPLIIKFSKVLFDKDHRGGVTLDNFIDAIIKFGTFENDDVIRRIFELYYDDPENDTISMSGLRKITNDLEVEPYRGDMNLLYKFAQDKNTTVSYVEFRDYIKSEIKKGNIKLPKKL